MDQVLAVAPVVDVLKLLAAGGHKLGVLDVHLGAQDLDGLALVLQLLEPGHEPAPRPDAPVAAVRQAAAPLRPGQHLRLELEQRRHRRPRGVAVPHLWVALEGEVRDRDVDRPIIYMRGEVFKGWGV